MEQNNLFHCFPVVFILKPCCTLPYILKALIDFYLTLNQNFYGKTQKQSSILFPFHSVPGFSNHLHTKSDWHRIYMYM